MRESVRIAFLDVAIRFQFIFFKCVISFRIALVIYEIVILDIPLMYICTNFIITHFIIQKVEINYVNYGKLFYMQYIRIHTELLKTQLESTFRNYTTLYE